MNFNNGLGEKAIQDVMQSYPEIGVILSRYDIGCTTCKVGICLLKDVVSIHGLSKEDDILYPLAERVIPVALRCEILQGYQTAEAQAAPNLSERYSAIVARYEQEQIKTEEIDYADGQ